MKRLARKINLKTWQRSRQVKSAMSKTLISTTGKVIVVCSLFHEVLHPGMSVTIPEQIIRYEVIAYESATVTIQ